MSDISWPCSVCDFTAESYKQLKKHMKSEHIKTDSKPQVTHEPNIEDTIKNLKQPAPIRLEYNYKGTCPDCASQVETIVLELDKKTRVTVVAWCPRCKKQLETREEAKLDYEQPKGKNEKT
jgi:hypothetical protein